MGIDVVMMVKIPRPVTPEEVKRVAVRMQIAMGSEGIGLVDRPGQWRPEGEHSLHISIDHDYEGILEDYGIDLKPTDTLVRLHTLARYYGPGYERGPLATARFLRAAFAPHAVVYYGGDSGGGLRPLDRAYEDELWAHFTSAGSRAYFAYGMREEGTVTCDFCEVRSNAYMFSGAEITSSCPSCGARWTKNTKTGIVRRHSESEMK